VYPKSHIHSFYELYATWLGRHGGTLFLGCDTKSGPLNHASTQLVPTFQIEAGPSQPARTPGPQESGRVPEREKTLVPQPTRSTQVRRKNTERSARSSRGQSPGGARPFTRSRTPDRTKTPERAKTPDHGKAPMAQALPALGTDCMILEQWVASPSFAMTARERRTASISCGQNRERVAESDHSPRRSSRKKKRCWLHGVPDQETDRERNP
jgi:hypothetical protein